MIAGQIDYRQEMAGLLGGREAGEGGSAPSGARMSSKRKKEIKFLS